MIAAKDPRHDISEKATVVSAETTYAAIRKLLDISYDSRFHLHHLLDSGEALVFDNARVLHARIGFNGNRH